MDFYKLMKKRTITRRIVFAIALLIVSLIIIGINFGEVKKYFDGATDINKIDTADRYLDKLEGEYVTLTVTDLQGYVNGFDGEQKGLLYSMIPTTKSGWIVGYEGCVQYSQLITYGKYNDEFQKVYEELIAFDEGNGEKPDVQLTVTGKVVKKNDMWSSFFTMYASELVSTGEFKTVEEVRNAMGGEYMIDMTQGKPLKQCCGLFIGIILVCIAIYVILGYYLGTGRKKMRECYKKYSKKYTKEFIYEDYKNGYVIGTTVLTSRFLYYIKGFDYEMFSLENISTIKRSKMGAVSKITIVDLKGHKHSFFVHGKYGKKIVKLVTSVLQEIEEFGIID